MLHLYIAVSLFVIGLVGLVACVIDFFFGTGADRVMWGIAFLAVFVLGFRETRFELQRDVRES